MDTVPNRRDRALANRQMSDAELTKQSIDEGLRMLQLWAGQSGDREELTYDERLEKLLERRRRNDELETRLLDAQRRSKLRRVQ